MPGYADKLEGEDCDVLKLRPRITGPATLKYRLEDEMIADFVRKARSYDPSTSLRNQNENLGFALPENVKEMTDQELAVWYNDGSTSLTTGAVIHPDKVRLNRRTNRWSSESRGKTCFGYTESRQRKRNKEKENRRLTSTTTTTTP